MGFELDPSLTVFCVLACKALSLAVTVLPEGVFEDNFTGLGETRGFLATGPESASSSCLSLFYNHIKYNNYILLFNGYPGTSF